MSNVKILPQVAAFLDRRHGCFIDGQWVFAEGQRIAVVNPATGQTLCETLRRSSPACGLVCVPPTANASC